MCNFLHSLLHAVEKNEANAPVTYVHTHMQQLILSICKYVYAIGELDTHMHIFIDFAFK